MASSERTHEEWQREVDGLRQRLASLERTHLDGLTVSEPQNQDSHGGVVRVTREITAPSGQERGLAENLDQFNYFFHSNMLGMVIWNAAGVLTEANDAFLNIVGCSREDVSSSAIEWAALTPPEYRYLEELAGEEASANGGRARPFEKVLLRKDGTRVPVLVGGVRTAGQPGVAFVLDLTERKQAEAQFHEVHKLEAIGRLAGGIAHDFNNLLTIISGYCEILLGQLRPEEAFWNPLLEIQKAGQRAADLTQRLLAFARKQILQPQVIDLNEKIAALLPVLTRPIGPTVQLISDLSHELEKVFADPAQFEEVILHLTRLALERMPQGGKLTIQTRNVVLDEAYTRNHADVQPGKYIALHVMDNGPLLDAKKLATIFEPFPGPVEMNEPSGLYLASIQGIVLQSGGYIAVESTPGVGNSFQVYLPALPESSKAVKPREKKAGRADALGRILLVEDERAVRELTRRMLQNEGYVVMEAGSGAEALEVAHRHEGPIDLLLTDVVMPGISGRQLAEELRKSRPEMKILYFTGYSPDAILQHGLAKEESYLLRKPFTSLTLSKKVRGILDKD